MDTFKQGISVNVGKNPSKNNMEEGQFSLMRKIFRKSISTHRNNAGSTQNLSYQDSSTYTERKKAIALGDSMNKIASYRSYDPVYVGHVIKKQHSSGAVVPKKAQLKN